MCINIPDDPCRCRSSVSPVVTGRSSCSVSPVVISSIIMDSSSDSQACPSTASAHSSSCCPWCPSSCLPSPDFFSAWSSSTKKSSKSLLRRPTHLENEAAARVKRDKELYTQRRQLARAALLQRGRAPLPVTGLELKKLGEGGFGEVLLGFRLRRAAREVPRLTLAAREALFAKNDRDDPPPADGADGHQELGNKQPRGLVGAAGEHKKCRGGCSEGGPQDARSAVSSSGSSSSGEQDGPRSSSHQARTSFEARRGSDGGLGLERTGSLLLGRESSDEADGCAVGDSKRLSSDAGSRSQDDGDSPVSWLETRRKQLLMRNTFAAGFGAGYGRRQLVPAHLQPVAVKVLRRRSASLERDGALRGPAEEKLRSSVVGQLEEREDGPGARAGEDESESRKRLTDVLLSSEVDDHVVRGRRSAKIGEAPSLTEQQEMGGPGPQEPLAPIGAPWVSAARETEIMRRLRLNPHPNVVEHFGMLDIENRRYIVLSLLSFDLLVAMRRRRATRLKELFATTSAGQVLKRVKAGPPPDRRATEEPDRRAITPRHRTLIRPDRRATEEPSPRFSIDSPGSSCDGGTEINNPEPSCLLWRKDYESKNANAQTTHENPDGEREPTTDEEVPCLVDDDEDIPMGLLSVPLLTGGTTPTFSLASKPALQTTTSPPPLTLQQRLKAALLSGLSPREAQQVARHIGKGLQHLHGLGIAHLDLKLENVMLEDLGVRRAAGSSDCLFARDGHVHQHRDAPPGELEVDHAEKTVLEIRDGPCFRRYRVRIIDLENAFCFSERGGGSSCLSRAQLPPPGTKTYRAPELAPKSAMERIDLVKVDLWALGVLLFKLLYSEARGVGGTSGGAKRGGGRAVGAARAAGGQNPGMDSQVVVSMDEPMFEGLRVEALAAVQVEDAAAYAVTKWNSPHAKAPRFMRILHDSCESSMIHANPPPPPPISTPTPSCSTSLPPSLLTLA